jgi:hypothetical protein
MPPNCSRVTRDPLISWWPGTRSNAKCTKFLSSWDYIFWSHPILAKSFLISPANLWKKTFDVQKRIVHFKSCDFKQLLMFKKSTRGIFKNRSLPSKLICFCCYWLEISSEFLIKCICKKNTLFYRKVWPDFIVGEPGMNKWKDYKSRFLKNSAQKKMLQANTFVL